MVTTSAHHLCIGTSPPNLMLQMPPFTTQACRARSNIVYIHCKGCAFTSAREVGPGCHGPWGHRAWVHGPGGDTQAQGAKMCFVVKPFGECAQCCSHAWHLNYLSEHLGAVFLKLGLGSWSSPSAFLEPICLHETFPAERVMLDFMF